MYRRAISAWGDITGKPSSFTPSAHKASHQKTGADEISVCALSGTLADPQDAGAIKGVTINDAAKADQKVLAYDSGTERIIYITQAPSGAAINNIQRFDETFSSQTIRDVTITEVDTTKTMLLFNGHLPAGIRDREALVSIVLLNATTVRLQKYDAAYDPRIAFTVVEYSSGIESIQRGVAIMTSQAILDVTINEVDLAKSITSWLNLYSNDSSFGSSYVVSNLLDATTLRLQRDWTGPNVNVSWEVIEFT